MRSHVVKLVHVWLCCLTVMQASCHSVEDRGKLITEVENNGNEALQSVWSRRLHKHHKNREEHRNYELEQQRDRQQKPAQQPVKTIDYREYSCGEINEMEAKYNSNNHSSSTTSFDRCKFAMTCNDGDGILFPSLFCTTAPTNNTDSTKQGYTSPRNNSLQSLSRILLIVGLSLVLLLLFRLLNSTTDEFFSPGLELFSLHLGLPPRFAGVTLLALGNGAPDVAATMNAMIQDEKNGYLMAMGELTGTTMFVSAVILGVIVRLSGDSESDVGGTKGEGGGSVGVPCKGPFLRDIAVLCLVSVISMSYFEDGVIDHSFVHAMLGIYVVYVLLVFSADAYHIFYHLPKLAREQECEDSNGDVPPEEEEDEQVISIEYGKWKEGDPSKCKHEQVVPIKPPDERTPLTHCSSSKSDGSRQHNRHNSGSRRPHSHTLGDTVIEAMSNYSCHEQQEAHNHSSFDRDNSDTTIEIAPIPPSKSHSPSSKPTGWGPTSADGTEALVTFHPHHAIHPHHEGQVVFRRPSTYDSINGMQANTPHSEGVVLLDAAASVAQKELNNGSDALISIEQRSDSQTIQSRPNSWTEAWDRNIQEWNDHWIYFFRDIYRNSENSTLEVILLSVELPFTILRKLTNPVPCDGYYCRPVVAVSFALSPVWVYFYFIDQFGVDIFSSSIGYFLAAANLVIAALIFRYSPDGDGPMDFFAVIPMTLYGFAIAASWLDAIADKLVELLELFGILLRIPNTIMGVTVLAFGNSLQDLVANVSLSKKGLNTMAITACLAGPIFNMCVGLGGGFWVLMKSTGKDEIHVKFPRNLKTGFYFTIANCALVVLAGAVFGKGVIGRGYGYVACGLYAVYVLTSLLV